LAKLKSYYKLIFFLVLGVTIFTGCEEDKNPTPPPEPFDIVDVWEVTEIEGAPPVSASNSTWTFNANGTYEWFLLLAGHDWTSEGNYSLEETTLTCDGFITIVTGTEEIEITISNNNNTFSFLDGDGDRWTYDRVE